MQLKKIDWYSSLTPLSEAVTAGIQFAFVSRKGQQCHQFVFCKDFLHDAIQSCVLKTKRSIYHFEYNPKKNPPIDLDKTRLIVVNSNDQQLRERISSCLDFLHQVETQLRITKTKVRECKNPPQKYILGGAWYFEGSRRWISAPPMISMYTLLIRVGMMHVIEKPFRETIKSILSGDVAPYLPEDKSRLKYGFNGINQILNLGDRKIFPRNFQINYPKLPISLFHNKFGIVGFSSGLTKPHIPVWHKHQEKSC